MIYRRLGRTGLKVSALSYGAWVTFGTSIDVPQAKEILQAAKDAGVNLWDNAEAYAQGKAEEIMGQAIKELGWKRSDEVITTKIFWGGSGPNDKGLSRKHIIEGTKASLKRLQLDYVDLVFAHRPDPDTPIEETVRAFNWCLDHGLALYWGTSEWSAAQLQEAWDVANRLGLQGPVVEQPEYNIFHRHKVEEEFKPIINKYGLGLTTWSPLASGVLTGKYSGGKVPEGSRLALENHKDKLEKKKHQILAADELKPIADELGCSLAQLALAWILKNPNVSTVITGATKVEQVKENLAAIQYVSKLTDEHMKRIDEVVKKHEALEK